VDRVIAGILLPSPISDSLQISISDEEGAAKIGDLGEIGDFLSLSLSLSLSLLALPRSKSEKLASGLDSRVGRILRFLG